MVCQIAEEKDATPAPVSLAWMLAQRLWIVPIPETRKISQLKENAKSAVFELTPKEVVMINTLLDKIPMSKVFGRIGFLRRQCGISQETFRYASHRNG